jgi:hypothetical protein
MYEDEFASINCAKFCHHLVIPGYLATAAR